MKAPVFNPEWPKEVRAVYQHDIEEIWDPKLAPHLWNQYHNLLDMYFELVDQESRDILDVGCAQATLAMLLAEKGHRVTAVDIRQLFLDYARSRYTHGDIDFVCGNALEMDLGKSFDFIFANQILEHLVYPVEFVQSLKRFLKPGGMLVMSTPNEAYLKNDLPSFTELGDPKQWEYMQFTADGDGHFFAYTMAELTSIMKRAGLEKIEVRHFETPWISGHMKVRYLHGKLPVGFLRALDRFTLGLPYLGLVASHQLLVTGRAL